ncbi:MAG TPA: hypothetical protein PLZ43_01420 [bacterium]|nr:hypothetical protein [bacterium]
MNIYKFAAVITAFALFAFSGCEHKAVSLSDEDAGYDDTDAVQSDEGDIGPDDAAADIDSFFSDDDPDEDVDEMTDEDSDADIIQNIPSETGFIVIEPVSYQMKTTLGFVNKTSDEARIFYYFQPADENMEEKPLAVFFNGGPGSASDFLMGLNTGPRSLDQSKNGGLPVGPGPASWSSFANLLYIDARNTGFSYSIGSASDGMSAQNFNPFFDGADFVRTVLRVLSSHPAIQKNPVIIVGESYGGTRASIMSHLLLFPDRYGSDGENYRDPLLVSEIKSHYSTVFSELSGTVPSAEKAATQFSGRVLIQPYLFGSDQDTAAGELFEEEGSPPYIIESETGTAFSPCKDQLVPALCDPSTNTLIYVQQFAGRDPYKYNENSSWSGDLEASILPAILSLKYYKEFFGSDPSAVQKMYSSERVNGYKTTSNVIGTVSDWVMAPVDVDQTEFVDAFGTLGTDDSYYLSMNNAAYVAYETETFSYHNTVFGELFLETLLYMKTFITKAGYDIICYSPAVPVAMSRQSSVESVSVEEDKLSVLFKESSFDGVSSGTTREIAFVPYDESGHTVSAVQPEKFLSDVRVWGGW